MYDPSGNYSALFFLEPDVSLDFVSGNIRTNCFPRDHSLSVYCNVRNRLKFGEISRKDLLCKKM